MPASEDRDLQRKRKLVEALVACNCMQTPQSRDQVISDLRPDIRQRIKRFPGTRQDVDSIFSTCADFEGGIAELLQIVEYQEGPSRAWQKVQEMKQSGSGEKNEQAAVVNPPAEKSRLPVPPGSGSPNPSPAPAPPAPAPTKTIPDAPNEVSAKNKLIVFSVLIVVVLLLTLTLASGWLRSGQSGPFIYVLYVLCGLLAAYVCYGLLSSMGELEGKQYGVALKLGGPIVALVVVAGGGGLYERYGQTPGSFAQRINFYTAQTSQLEKINGTATVSIGNERRAEVLRESGSALYQGIPSSLIGKPLVLDLESANYELAPDNSAALLTDREPIFIKVVRKRQFATPNAANLELSFREGIALNYIARPDAKNIVLTLRAVSKSEQAIPIDADATLEILSNSGVPMFSVPMKVTDTTIIPPRGLETIHLDGFLLKDQYAFALTGKTAVVKLRYDRQIEKSEMEFQTEFDFSKKTVPATR